MQRGRHSEMFTREVSGATFAHEERKNCRVFEGFLILELHAHAHSVISNNRPGRVNIVHHAMHTPQKPSTKKDRSINFAAINPKFLIMIDNHASYNKKLFGARYATYEAGEPRECVFSVLLLFLLPSTSTILAGFLVLGGRSCEILKLAINVLKYII